MRIPVLVRARTATLAGVALLAALITAALVLVVPGLIAPASAVDVLQGSGTAASPYLISSDADLDQARSMIDADTAHTGAAAAHYELTTNLDYSQDSSNTTNAATASWAGFDFFTGVFDGEGHTVSNLTYTTDSAAVDPTYVGFFRVLTGATVENLTLNNANFNVSSSANVGGVVAMAYASTITGVSVTNPTFKSTSSGDVGGIAGQSFADDYADASNNNSAPGNLTGCISSSPTHVGDLVDGGTTNLTNDLVGGGSITGAAYASGITGYAKGPVNIDDNYIDTTLAVTGASPQMHDDAAGLVAYMGTTDCTSTGADAAPVSMRNNVINGSIKYNSSGARSNGSSQNYSSPTVGWATTSASSPQYDNWSASNNLVSSSFTYTDATGTGLTAAAEGDADGTSVSDATLGTEATLSGNATGQTDATTSATYNQLGWDVGATVDGTDTVSAWSWSSSSSIPAVAQAPTMSLGQSSLNYETSASPSNAALLTAIDPTSTGSTPILDTSAVTWGTAGNYTANVSSSNQGLVTTDPVSVDVVPVPVISTTNTTVDFNEATTVTAAAVLQAAGAELTDGNANQLSGGSLSVDISQVDSGVHGQYTATITGTDAQGFSAQPVTITVDIANVAISLGDSTLHIEKTATAPSAATILSDLQASLSSGGNDANLSVDLSAVSFNTPGSYTAVVSDTDAADDATPINATIDIVPVPVITPTSTTVDLGVNGSATAAAIISAAGATLTDGSGNAVQGTVTATLPDGGISTSAPGGPYTVTLDGTDQYGDSAAPVQITVNVVWTTAPVIAVAHPTIFVSAQLGSTPTQAQLIQDFGATVDHGTISLDLTGINWASPGTYPITIDGSDTGTPSSSANATIVVAPLVGSGTAGDPFQIGSLSDLQTAQTLVNTGPTAYQGADYELTSNIDLGGANWGGFDFFSGVFNGNGHTISNGTLSTDTTATVDSSNLGFFRVLNQATIENVSFNTLQINSAGTANNGLVVAMDYASAINDVALVDPSITDTGSGGDQGLFAGQTFAVTYADEANNNTVSGVTSCPSSNPMSFHDETDGHTASFTNDMVVNGTVSTVSYASGVTGYAKGPITIADDDIDVNLTITGNTPQKSYNAAGLVAYMGTTDCTSTGALAAPVAMHDNVISGSITYKSPGARSSGGDQNFSSPTVGWATTSATSPQYDNWSASNNLVNSGFAYNTSGSGLTGAAEGDADGTLVSPATLQTESTYSGTSTGQTDGDTGTTYNQLGWDFTTPVWAWSSASDSPGLSGVAQVVEPAVTLTTTSVTYPSNAMPSDATILSALGASISPSSGTLTLNREGADLGTPGTYTVEVSGTFDGATAWPAQATITIVSAPSISSQLTTIQYAEGSPVSEAQFLADIGAEISPAGGTMSVDFSAVDWDTPGDYTAVISGANSQGYDAVPVDVTVEILSTGGSGGGNPQPTVTPGNVAIDGTPQVGTQLTADPGTWSPTGTPTFQWLEDGSPISGQTSVTYTPQPADAGQMLQVAVTEDGETVTSAGVTVGAGMLTGTAPTISGTPTVGQTLTAAVDWAYSDLSVSYQWLSNGQPISGAVGSTYTLQPADANQEISVEVIGGMIGYSSLELTSQPVTVQPAPQGGGNPDDQSGGNTSQGGGSTSQSGGNTDSNGGSSPSNGGNSTPSGGNTAQPLVIVGPVPTILGTPATGQKLSVSTGSWTSGAALAYQWMVGGKAIPGATGASFEVSAADVGAAISVQVTGSAAGATPGSETATAVKGVKGKLRGAKPKIKGTAKVGTTLTASPGSWGPKPKLAYRWYVAGKAVKGNQRASLKLTAADSGKRVSVKVSGSEAGYTTLTEASASTKAVR